MTGLLFQTSDGKYLPVHEFQTQMKPSKQTTSKKRLSKKEIKSVDDQKDGQKERTSLPSQPQPIDPHTAFARVVEDYSLWFENAILLRKRMIHALLDVSTFNAYLMT
jgi:hypothetical protein